MAPLDATPPAFNPQIGKRGRKPAPVGSERVAPAVKLPFLKHRSVGQVAIACIPRRFLPDFQPPARLGAIARGGAAGLLPTAAHLGCGGARAPAAGRKGGQDAKQQQGIESLVHGRVHWQGKNMARLFRHRGRGCKHVDGLCAGFSGNRPSSRLPAMKQPVLQARLPFAPWMDPRTARLPGILPVEGDDWILQDDAYAGQMAERDARLAAQEDAVHALLPEAAEPAAELLGLILQKLTRTPGFAVGADAVLRPDGVQVALGVDNPLKTAGRLVQEDLCLLQPDGGEHRLTGAVLCFPASWTLAEKIGRPMTVIHRPVHHYTEDIARRVQRLFDAIRPEQALWRMNALVYDDPALFQPRPEGAQRPPPVERRYMRCERQCLLRLPRTGAVVFTIHTYLVRLEDLDPAARAGMAAAGL